MLERIRRAGQASWAFVGLAALLTLIGFVFWYFRVIFPPLMLAGAIVFILNPVVTWLQRRRVPRAAGTALTYLGLVGAVFLVGVLVAPLASDQGRDLADRWPEIRDDVETWINDVSERSKEDDWLVEIPSVAELEDEFGSNGTEDVGDQLETVRDFGLRVFHVALIIILAPILAFYLLVDLPHLRRVAESLVPENAKPEVLLLGRRLNRAIGGFFRGQLLVAAIVGTMVSIGLAIIDLKFWLIVGMIAGVFNMVPLIGPYIGAVPGVIIALTTRDFSTALWVVAIMTGAQQIDNHFVTPNVMQRAVKLHPVTVMLALLAGGTLFGFFGLLIAVPTAAVGKILLSHAWHTYVLDEPVEEIAARLAVAEGKADGGVVAPVGEDVDGLGDDGGPVAGDGTGAGGADGGGDGGGDGGPVVVGGDDPPAGPAEGVLAGPGSASVAPTEIPAPPERAAPGQAERRR